MFVGVRLDFEMKGTATSRLEGEAQGKELQPLLGILDSIMTHTHTHTHTHMYIYIYIYVKHSNPHIFLKRYFF